MKEKEVKKDYKDWNWKLNWKEQEHQSKRLSHKVKLFRAKFMTLQKNIIEK